MAAVREEVIYCVKMKQKGLFEKNMGPLEQGYITCMLINVFHQLLLKDIQILCRWKWHSCLVYT